MWILRNTDEVLQRWVEVNPMDPAFITKERMVFVLKSNAKHGRKNKKWKAGKSNSVFKVLQNFTKTIKNKIPKTFGLSKN